jgi:translation elongation factor EF-1alpha
MFVIQTPANQPWAAIFCKETISYTLTISFLTGMVDKRTMEKYEKEAKEQNRESWYLSWALDTNAEERAKVNSSFINV